MSEQKPFPRRVWETLSKVDVGDRIEQKNGLNYLSWSLSWGTLMEFYPESEYELLDTERLDDGTCLVWVSVTVRDGESSLKRAIWLPVMDHRNKAIQNPDAMALNKTRMRALTKCIAMFGLGHYIYTGEDIPLDAPPEPPALVSDIQANQLRELLTLTGTEEEAFLAYLCGNSSTKYVSVSELPENWFATAKTALEKKLAKLTKGGGDDS